MSWTQISDNYWVSPQLTESDVTAAKEFGIEVIVCNRPDGESEDQIPSATIQACTQDLGIDFKYLPMNGPNFTVDYVETVEQLISQKKKVLAYCRTGNRSSVLFNATNG